MFRLEVRVYLGFYGSAARKNFGGEESTMFARGWRIAARRGGASVLLASALGVALAPASASAQPAAPAAGSQVNADAQQLFADGQSAIKLNQWDKARTLFQGAWRIQQHWKIAASLGRAELKVGRMRDAAEHLSFALREGPANTLTPEARQPLEEMLTQARAKVGAVKVSGAPDGAELTVDGLVVEKAPLKGELFVEPGAHRVGGKREGYVDGEGAVEAGAGAEAGVDLRMVKVPAPKVVGVVDNVGEGAVVPAAGPNRAIVVAGAVLTAVGLGMGGALLRVSFAKASDRDAALKVASCPYDSITCSHDVANAESARSVSGGAAGWSFIAAGVIGAATVTYVLLPRSSKVGSGTKAAFSAGPGGVGMTVVGSW